MIFLFVRQAGACLLPSCPRGPEFVKGKALVALLSRSSGQCESQTAAMLVRAASCLSESQQAEGSLAFASGVPGCDR